MKDQRDHLRKCIEMLIEGKEIKIKIILQVSIKN